MYLGTFETVRPRELFETWLVTEETQNPGCKQRGDNCLTILIITVQPWPS